ncbi:MAG: ThuA domain-containing protein [Sedimentisphaerales bacterium]|nr:ThuA domain-containing protein [Sedimentisphaerales bacterium]
MKMIFLVHNFRRIYPAWFLFFLGVSCLAGCLDLHKGQRSALPKKILVVTGVDYPGHKWQETTPVLVEGITQDKRLLVTVTENPADLADNLDQYEGIVLHFMNWEVPDPGPAARENLKQFVRNGGGLVLVHFACGAFQGWPEFASLAGRAWDPQLRPHDPHGKFNVAIVDHEHPITKNMDNFETVDELYTCLAGDTPICILAKAQSKVDGKNYPIAFVLNYGKGRVFHCVLGHDVQAFVEPKVLTLFRNACLWTTGVDVAQNP